MKIKHLIVGVLTAITASANAQCFVQTFGDEFDSTSLDLTKWDYQPGDGCPVNCGWGNNELEYYTTSANNVSVANGQLTITARYEPNYNGTGKNYTSGKLVTLGKFSQMYGKIEARIKMPSAQGAWPAFWMLADNTNWPTTGEIDIIECKGLNPTTGYNTIHYGSKATGGHLSTGTTWNYPATLSADFHVYAIEWDANIIRWYLDGALKFTATKTTVTKKGTWPFSSQNFYIILNLAVGGNFAGSANSAQFPVSMVVDYVHAYQYAACARIGETQETEAAMTIMPNPANNNAVISLSTSDVSSDATYEVVAPTGNIVKSAAINGMETTLDVSDLNAGIYVVIVRNSGKVYRTKMVKE